MAIQPKATDTIKVNTIECKTGSTLTLDPIVLVDVIKEKTSSARTTLFHGIKTDTIAEKTASAKVDFPDDIKTDVIAESTSATGVTIDGLLVKDSHVNETISSYTPTVTATNITGTISDQTGRYSYITNKLVYFEANWTDNIVSLSGTAWFYDVSLPVAAAAIEICSFSVEAFSGNNIMISSRWGARVSPGSSSNVRVSSSSASASTGTWNFRLSGVVRIP